MEAWRRRRTSESFPFPPARCPCLNICTHCVTNLPSVWWILLFLLKPRTSLAVGPEGPAALTCCCIHCPYIHCVPHGCISSRWWRWAFLELGLSVGSCESTPAKESWSGGWAVFHGAAKSSDELSGIAWNEWPWETQLWLQDSFSLAGIDPPVLSNGQNGSFLPSVFFSQQECGLPDRG